LDEYLAHFMTSAMMMRWKALAMEALALTRSKSMERLETRQILALRIDRMKHR
jgi:hypothetical protein